MSVLDEFFLRWERAGFGNLYANVWEGRRLYINIDGEPPVWFELKPGAAGRTVHSGKLLSGRLFNEARKMGYFVVANRQALKEALGGQRVRHNAKGGQA